MSFLFRHTLENVTSFQARPGKRSTAEGGRAPDRGELVPDRCLPPRERMRVRALMTHYVQGVCALQLFAAQ